MPTDDERREVARRLRGARYGWRSWERALYDALGVDTETAGLGMLDRLADLIEPSCDRDALLALADELSSMRPCEVFDRRGAAEISCRIREAIGVKDEDD